LEKSGVQSGQACGCRQVAPKRRLGKRNEPAESHARRDSIGHPGHDLRYPAGPSQATAEIVVRSRYRIVLAADIRAAYGLNPGLQQEQIDHKAGLIESGNAKITFQLTQCRSE
jgi:hypothetical protein